MTTAATPLQNVSLTADQTDALSKVRTLGDSLNASFMERRDEVRALLVAMLAREHVLLLGPPGTAKSALTQAFSRALDGSRYFERLLTPFSVPEEMFGPFSVAGLQADRYERKVDGYLPTADVAFIDECFKANSAILNSLLTILNERAFDQGSTRVRCPLQIAIGASNELPQDESLAALYDRFVLRRWVEPVKSESNLRSLITMTGAPSVAVRITVDEIEAARTAADAVLISDDTVDALIALKKALSRECGIEISDRRLRKSVSLVKAYTALSGAHVAEPEHLHVLADSLWDEPSDRAAVQAQVDKVSKSPVAEAKLLLDAAVEARESLNLDKVTMNDLDSMVSVSSALKAMASEIQGLGLDESRTAVFVDQIMDMQREVAAATARVV